jgi:hypothetical protein
MASVTLVSVALAAFTVVVRTRWDQHTSLEMAAYVLVGTPMFGAGICAPFKCATAGAIVGFILAVVWVALGAWMMRYADV